MMDPKIAFIQALADHRTEISEHYRWRTHDSVVLAGIIATIGHLPDRVYISTIQAMPTGKGHGTRVMNFLCDLADRTKVRIYLTPTPLPKSDTPVERLIGFYTRFGFELLPDTVGMGFQSMERFPK